MSCPCGGCKLYGTFECVSSMDLQSLMNKIGITFLPAGDDPTDDPNKLDEELEKRFMDWRSKEAEGKEGFQIDLTPNIEVAAAKKKSHEEEQSVLNLFRDQVEQSGMSDVSFYPNFKPGPLLGKAKFGKNLTTILNSSEKTRILLTAFNIPDPDKHDTDWKKHLNKHRREHDLVVVFGALAHLLLIEVKGGKRPGNYEAQFRCFKDYMQRCHKGFLNNVTFLPVLARHCNAALAQLCDQYQFDIPSEVEDLASKSPFPLWWTKVIFPLMSDQQKDVQSADVNPLLKRMLLTSSLVLTSLPQTFSQVTPYSHLIILSKNQWQLFAARPSFAVIEGEPTTGKSMALELGLALLGEDQSCRILISLKEEGHVQNVLRKSFFNDSGIDFKCYENIVDIPLETFSNDSIIAIDDFPAEDLLKPGVGAKLMAIKKNSKHFWIVLKGSTNSCEKDSTSLGSSFVKFQGNME